MIKNPVIGNTAWFESAWASVLIRGTIKEIIKDEKGTAIGAAICWEEDEHGSRCPGNSKMQLEKLYGTLLEARKAREDEERRAVEAYLSEIHSVEDLALFCFEHCVAQAEEYTNWEARKAAQIKFEEYGIAIPAY